MEASCGAPQLEGGPQDPPDVVCPAADSPQTTPKADKRLELGQVLAVVTALGSGCSAGYYLAAAGFFCHQFESPRVLLHMLAALYMPSPLLIGLHEHWDSFFDKRFGTQVTFPFRVGVVQQLGALFFVLLGATARIKQMVFVLGVLIGVMHMASMTSLIQLMAAWDPSLAVWTSLGKDLGSSLPILTYALFRFSATRSTWWDFRFIQVFPFLVLTTSAQCYGFWHLRGTVFTKPYARLSYDLDVEGGFDRHLSESDPLLPGVEVDSRGVPLWIPRWWFAIALNAFLSFLLIPVCAFQPDADLTQTLVLLKLAMDCSSRVLGTLWARTQHSHRCARHGLLCFQVVSRVVLFFPLMFHLLGVQVFGKTVALGGWGLFYLLGGFVASMGDVTCSRFVPVAARKAVSRITTNMNFVAVALALAVDMAFI